MKKRIIRPKLTKKEATQKAMKRIMHSKLFPLSGFQICQMYSKAEKVGVN
ncbi:MAG: hypothetical protein JSW17_04890 [Candidatus Omnitrophota bacterium]|nr:MAG: hypothetical protein JSW17_04890 [Candidatus Omnitrophota bacterium]